MRNSANAADIHGVALVYSVTLKNYTTMLRRKQKKHNGKVLIPKNAVQNTIQNTACIDMGSTVLHKQIHMEETRINDTNTKNDVGCFS